MNASQIKLFGQRTKKLGRNGLMIEASNLVWDEAYSSAAALSSKIALKYAYILAIAESRT